MDKYKYMKCFEYVSERYYTNLLANLHTKIFLKVISILYTVITYFHPNFVDSEWYTDSFATTVDWRVSYRAETEKSVFPGCCADRARQVQVELEEQCESIHIQGSTWSGLSCPHVAQLLFLHLTEKSNAEGRVQSDSLVSEQHSCTIYFLAMGQWGKSMHLPKCQILYLKMGTIHTKLRWSLNEVSTWR